MSRKKVQLKTRKELREIEDKLCATNNPEFIESVIEHIDELSDEIKRLKGILNSVKSNLRDVE